MEMTPRGMPELVKTLEDVKKVMDSWTDGISGIKANVVDRDKHERGHDRAIRARLAKQLRETEGWVAAAR
jgi:hypothetical protein